MPANVSPIYSRLADIQWIGGVTVANTSKDGSTGTVYIVFAADATNGGRVDKLVIMPNGTNVATVMRVFLNNGAVTTTNSNNSLVKDLTLPATTNSEVAELGATEVPLDLPIPPGYRIFVTIGTGVAAGFAVTAVGGKY